MQLETVAIRGGLFMLRRSTVDRPMSRWKFTDAERYGCISITFLPPLYHYSTTALELAELIGDPIDGGFQGGREYKEFL